MKNLLMTVSVAAIATCIAAPALAETIDVPITAITPNWSSSEIRVPVQNCSQELVAQDRNGSPIDVGNLFGGALGGFLGNQIGKGSGNVAATAAGAVGGWVLGGHLIKTPDQYQQQTVCKTTYRIEHQKFIQSYTVHYTFNGVRYQTRTIIPPQSNTLRLMVNTSHTIQK